MLSKLSDAFRMVLNCSIDWGNGYYYILCEFDCTDTNTKPIENK